MEYRLASDNCYTDAEFHEYYREDGEVMWDSARHSHYGAAAGPATEPAAKPEKTASVHKQAGGATERDPHLTHQIAASVTMPATDAPVVSSGVASQEVAVSDVATEHVLQSSKAAPVDYQASPPSKHPLAAHHHHHHHHHYHHYHHHHPHHQHPIPMMSLGPPPGLSIQPSADDGSFESAGYHLNSREASGVSTQHADVSGEASSVPIDFFRDNEPKHGLVVSDTHLPHLLRTSYKDRSALRNFLQHHAIFVPATTLVPGPGRQHFQRNAEQNSERNGRAHLAETSAAQRPSSHRVV